MSAFNHAMADIMKMPHLRWLLCALWVSLALLGFLLLDASSIRSWLYLIAAVMIPPAVLLMVWNEGPPPTVAELIRATEERR